MKLILKIFFLLLFVNLNFGQRLYKISVQIDNEKKSISYLDKNGVDYISLNELADLISAGKYYNKDAEKLELKFEKFNVKFTAKNPFIVIQNKTDNSIESYQLPISTLLIKNDIFIPLVYTIQYLIRVTEKNFYYESLSKNLTISSKKVLAEEKPEQKKNEKPFERNLNFDINDISIEEMVNGTLIKLTSNKIIRKPRNSISNNVLYVFFNDINIDTAIMNKNLQVGLVKNIVVRNLNANNSQLEISLNDGYSNVETFQDKDTKEILITVHKKLFVQAGENKTKWNFDCIVIDAGHGGKDPGTIGVTGVREKDINLNIALKLGKLIEHNIPEIKVVYTRKSDEFIELYKRGKIANEAGGKLFISIHCNSTEKKDNGYRGFEVYLLRPGRTKEAIRIAEFENSVIKYEDNPNRYEKLTDENFILVSMAHSQFMRYSETFSDFLNQSWKNETEIPSLGVKQAGFYVLVGASMPSVLIETGFLSNRKDEAYLASSEGQSEIAKAIFNSVVKYKEFYSKEIGK